MKRITGLLISLCLCSVIHADEGMWMLNQLKETNWKRMRELGFQLNPEQLYDTIQPSLKDAVVIFGGGCTGITVSDKGLIFTNHHCGYGAIQSQSSVEHNYLRDGFVARTPEEELPIPDLSVYYLIKTVDVTPEVLAGVSDTMTEEERTKAIEKASNQLVKQYTDQENAVMARVNAYFANNAYYLNLYEEITDVRLVFAPPSSIGKFGGDTDNWMWPRQTGDFSIFRAYANPDKKRGYQKENVPYKPKFFSKVSVEGYDKNSYAMTIGFPGRTARYLTSWGVEQRIKSANEPRIEVRGIKQEIWQKAMMESEAVKIKYASKYSGSSNYWKNSIGMNRGLERMHVIERKQALEQEFRKWLNANPDKKAAYGEVLDRLENAYISTDEAQRILTYLTEAFTGGAEIIRFATLANADANTKQDSLSVLYEKRLLPAYKDYEPALDEKVLTAMLRIVKERVPAQNLPDIYAMIDKKYKGNYARYSNDLFKKSIVPYQEKLKGTLLNPKKIKNLEKDPAVQLAQSVQKQLTALRDAVSKNRYDILKEERLFFAGLQEMEPEVNFPSDANFTMRMSYGSVGGYVPYDGAWYEYFTTTKGIFEKYVKDDYEFDVQPEILELLGKKDFGRYANGKGDINVDFLTNNDITGGNSGSPIFDGKGRLLGLAFDGNWEAMSGDIAFETDVQRCIGVDIRYILYIIDQWGHCRRLLDELNIE
ncbi:MAG: S46 family peptidase [Candidatus Azobacteroides sp.]|nr:S46 family peptidase [Candidatus Azobacteroides sp.]